MGNKKQDKINIFTVSICLITLIFGIQTGYCGETISEKCSSGEIELESKAPFKVKNEYYIKGGVNFFNGDYEVIHPGSVTKFELLVKPEGKREKRVWNKKFRSAKDTRYRGNYIPVEFKKKGRHKVTLTAFVKTNGARKGGPLRDVNCSVSYFADVN